MRSLSEQVAQLEEENRKLRAAAETLIHMYVANRGIKDSEFISCITPVHRSDPKSKRCHIWKAWDAAIAAVGWNGFVRVCPIRGNKHRGK